MNSGIREGTWLAVGILIELVRGAMWIQAQWRVEMGQRPHVVGIDPDLRLIVFADAAIGAADGVQVGTSAPLASVGWAGNRLN